MDTQQAIVEVTERPKVGDLIMEFKRNGSQGDQFGRMLRAEDTRLARWDGQSEDGKKHAKDQPDGDEVFPWEGASDVRDYLADGAVNESVALCYMAFWNAVLKISGATPNDTAASASATEFLDWVIHFQLLKQLDNEVELSAQYMHAIGATALHVTWEREVGRRLQPVTMEQLQGMAEQVDQQVAALIQQQRQVQMSGRGGQPVTQTAAGAATDAPGAGALPPELLQLQEVLGALPQMIEDPEMEGQTIKAVQYLFDEYVRRNLPEDIQEEEVLELSVKRARQAVKELRTEGKCEWPMPFLARNQPKIMALKPYRDFVLPVEVGAMETAPVVFVRDLMTEADLRRMVLGAGWDADWVEEAVKTKGRFSTWQLNNPYSAYGTWSWRAVDNRSWLIEVVYAYYKQIDDDGVTQITMTVFSPHLTTNPKGHDARAVEVKDGDGHVILDDFAGWFGILNYPRADYPVILGRRERFDRSWLATRGLAEILNTDQNVEKAMIDNVVDLAGISTVPPLNVPKGLTAKYKIGPAVQNEFVPGREPHFMQMPTAGMAPAETVVSGIRTRMNRYCGLFDAALPPQLAALLQQPMVKKFLIMWGEALQLAYELTVKFAPEKILAVTGQAPSGSLDDFHYVMQFDATQFHPELMEAKLAAFSDLAANDRTGTIDQAALTKFKAMMIDPGMAKQLVLDQGQASVALEKGVQSDLANMFLGSEAIYDDASNDPAANMKLGYAAKHLQGNPNFMAALDPRVAQEALGPQVAQQMAMAQAQNGSKPNGRFSELVANYLKNLKQGADQQANKGVGRTGVKQLT